MAVEIGIFMTGRGRADIEAEDSLLIVNIRGNEAAAEKYTKSRFFGSGDEKGAKGEELLRGWEELEPNRKATEFPRDRSPVCILEKILVVAAHDKLLRRAKVGEMTGLGQIEGRFRELLYKRHTVLNSELFKRIDSSVWGGTMDVSYGMWIYLMTASEYSKCNGERRQRRRNETIEEMRFGCGQERRIRDPISGNETNDGYAGIDVENKGVRGEKTKVDVVPNGSQEWEAKAGEVEHRKGGESHSVHANSLDPRPSDSY
ncbi:hypothetical protein C8J57DRAFT_1251376 [Mycena rebaudengoi]|nr:hypothetical protein C8J57DRAFT_1251376 [Mycena rebaudengoi]